MKDDNELDFMELMARNPTWLSRECFFNGPHGNGCSNPERCTCECHKLIAKKEEDEVRGT